MNTVYLVSSLELIHADKESVYLADALQKREITTKIVCWDDPNIDWNKADLVISRTTSTYFQNPSKFLIWAKQVEETTTLWNSYPVMEWNINKRYLLHLQNNGVQMPETILIPKNTEQPIQSILDMIPWGDFIIKPSIAAGSGGLRRFTKDDSEFENHFKKLNRYGFIQKYSFGDYKFLPCDTIIQPFIPEILGNGEASLIFFGGEFSHCMLKKVKLGDIRAHPAFGGEISIYEPSEKEVEVALSCLELVGYPTEYARVDMIPTDSTPLIIEVELLDPNLFFNYLPETVESFANHISNYLNR